MPQRIVEFLSKTIDIPKEEADILLSLIKTITLSKGEYLNIEGKIPKHGAFVISGLLREFYTDFKEVDFIRRFASENWWMVDLYELLHEKPALCSVQALEKTELLTFTKDDCLILMQKCPTAVKVLHQISAAEKYSLAKKEKHKKSLTAEENYNLLLTQYPGIQKRIPLFHIASYLNIKPESLSRIRKKMNLT